MANSIIKKPLDREVAELQQNECGIFSCSSFSDGNRYGFSFSVTSGVRNLVLAVIEHQNADNPRVIPIILESDGTARSKSTDIECPANGKAIIHVGSAAWCTPIIIYPKQRVTLSAY